MLYHRSHKAVDSAQFINQQSFLITPLSVGIIMKTFLAFVTAQVAFWEIVNDETMEIEDKSRMLVARAKKSLDACATDEKLRAEFNV